jgi:hypothetical protein
MRSHHATRGTQSVKRCASYHIPTRTSLCSSLEPMAGEFNCNAVTCAERRATSQRLSRS